MESTPATVHDYIAAQPAHVQGLLTSVRAAMLRGAPLATETIRYGMPAVMFAGRYGLHFASWKKHLGLYPVERLDEELESRVAPYRTHKDTLAFPYATPVPLELIEDITRALAGRHSG